MIRSLAVVVALCSVASADDRSDAVASAFRDLSLVCGVAVPPKDMTPPRMVLNETIRSRPIATTA